MRRYLLEITVFVSGAVVMIFELAGSRLVAPYLGNSIYVWSALIGVILASLSLGYWWGGRIADRQASYQNLGWIIFLAGASLSFPAFIKDIILGSTLGSWHHVAAAALIASFALFALPSFFLGLVSPYAVRLKMKDLNHSGRTVGNLYALSTAGSIGGTFLAGFVIIPLLGTIKIIFLLAAILVLLSFFLLAAKRWPRLVVLLLLATAIPFTAWAEKAEYRSAGRISFSTPYNEVTISTLIDGASGRQVINLATDRFGHQSSRFVDSVDLVSPYTKFYRLAEHFNPNFQKTLMIGGGAYVFPQYYLKAYPQARIDVVEIDPELTKLAKEYFSLSNDPRLQIIHKDGRSYLNQNQEKYDVVLMDAFNSISIPPQLTTKEAVQKIADSLTPEGVVLVNVISAVSGPRSAFFQAEYATYQSVFPQVLIFAVNRPDLPEMAQNIMIVALKSPSVPSLESSSPDIQAFLQNTSQPQLEAEKGILTDDYAPVDYYMSRILL